MTIDIRKITPECTVKLRCGGELTNCKVLEYLTDVYSLLCCDVFIHTYKKDGITYTSNIANHPLDIVEIIPPAFDWNKAKSGMCFIDNNGDKVYFIGEDFGNEPFIIVSTTDLILNNEQIVHFEKKHLTRHPEGDIK